MELLDVKLRPLTHAGPQDRATFLMDLEHVTFCFFARITEHPLKNHCDVGHQIYRIVMHHDLPWQVQFFFVPGLRFVSWSFNGGSRSSFNLHLDHPGDSFPWISPSQNGCTLMKKRLSQGASSSKPYETANFYNLLRTFFSAARILSALLASQSSKPCK